jgi:hypothetical protein
MMKTEVTKGLLKKVMGVKTEHPDTVAAVSWYDAVRFANALSKKEGLEECYSITFKKIEDEQMDSGISDVSNDSYETSTVLCSRKTKCKGWRQTQSTDPEYW